MLRREEADTTSYVADYLTRSVRRASGLVLARHPPTILATESIWQLKHRISLRREQRVLIFLHTRNELKRGDPGCGASRQQPVGDERREEPPPPGDQRRRDIAFCQRDTLAPIMMIINPAAASGVRFTHLAPAESDMQARQFCWIMAFRYSSDDSGSGRVSNNNCRVGV